MKCSHYIISLIFSCLLITSPLYACGSESKPKLIILVDELWNENANYCADYKFIFPTEFNNEKFLNANLLHGSGKEEIQVTPTSSKNYHNIDAEELTFDGTTSIFLCANPEWLSKIELTLHYQYESEGGLSLNLQV